MFSPLLPELSDDKVQLISLPDTGEQDYATLSTYVAKRLPKVDHILIAQSFSGPIAAMIAAKDSPNLKAIVFVATFLSPPQKTLLKFSKLLPITWMARFPFASQIHRFMFLGKRAPDDLVRLFQNTIASLDPGLLRKRIVAIESLKILPKKVDIPVLYLQASADKLVPTSKVEEFKETFEKLEVLKIMGPHFLLQANPQGCAKEISKFISTISM
ncbi:MAG: alpha/beta hydrolase [Parvularculaceae bacterium]